MYLGHLLMMSVPTNDLPVTTLSSEIPVKHLTLNGIFFASTSCWMQVCRLQIIVNINSSGLQYK